MNELRFVVADRVWQRSDPHLPGKASDAGAAAKDNRQFRLWAQTRVFESIFNAMSDDPDLERTHRRQHRAGSPDGNTGAKALSSLQTAIAGQQETHAHAIGQSRGGLTTRICARQLGPLSVAGPSRQIAARSPAGQWGRRRT